ncbi:MAG: hypothetical protein JWL83_2404 [Actinomycetia bacterium]|nr:hypothetical protein [Actinomycetes bacterium]
MHVRGDEWSAAQQMPKPLRARAVKYEPPTHEWVEEREWRAPGRDGLTFDVSEVQAIVAPTWTSPPSETSDPEEVPSWARPAPVWHWSDRDRAVHPLRFWPRPVNRRSGPTDV